ncbi:Putative major facilitator, sugar transporter, major facilitator superfamily [Septoria linicola]|uniref:Major facilitator, sugar transporter, major facilitator superfamily n=1 Tax=Septoria linicola TaxID=215465 RepID=A0A9Q9AMD0_9PEZI|nr:Putative major facilitator, sugar transporter, major facilitator superfamily [Septoria linicola]
MGQKARSNAIGDELLAVLPADDKPWYRKWHLVKLNLCILSLVLFSSANGYDGSLMNGLQALDQWQIFMDYPTGAWLGFMSAIYWVGNGINYPISAWVANKYGRKPGVYLGYMFMALGVALTAGEHDYYFVLQRFFIGCASAWFSGPVALLINEIAYPTHRGIASALYNCGWYVGGTIGAFVTFGTRNYEGNWSWRIPTTLQILIPIVTMPGFIMTPESPRWLVSKDRIEEARANLYRAHGGHESEALIDYEMLEITTALRLEQEAVRSASYMEMTRTKGNRHRLFITISVGFFSQWAGNGVVSYYLPMVLDGVGVTSTRDQTLISGCLQVWNLFFAVGAALMVDKLGRRFLFLASASTMLIGFIITTALSGSFAETGNAGIGLAVIPFLFVFFAGYDIALTPLLFAYPCEIWPYNLRGRGLSVMGLSVVVAIVFNTFINPIALEAIGWRYYIVFVAIIIVYGLTAYFFYPETSGHSLEQMAVVFDGPDALVADEFEIVERSKSVASEKRGGEIVHEERAA